MRKKIISAAMLVALTAGAVCAQDGVEKSKLQFGVRAGYSVNGMQQDDGRDVQTFEGVGWQVGGSAGYNLGEFSGVSSQIHIGVEAGLLFSNRMYFVDNDLNSLYSVEIPIVTAYTEQFAPPLFFKWQLGPRFRFGLAGSHEVFNKFRHINFGLTTGVGMGIGRFFLGTSYNIDLFNIAQNAPSWHTQRMISTDLTLGWNF
ncbi:MAG: PorT family protein [Prevotellaceae bacterium]|nr:PorT family protein [Prevotellaceae bacterium]